MLPNTVLYFNWASARHANKIKIMFFEPFNDKTLCKK